VDPLEARLSGEEPVRRLGVGRLDKLLGAVPDQVLDALAGDLQVELERHDALRRFSPALGKAVPMRAPAGPAGTQVEPRIAARYLRGPFRGRTMPKATQ